jgi:D-alanine-D-alanine ligase-like ATP-grasp enzyme
MDSGVPTAKFRFRFLDGKLAAGWQPPVVLKPVRQGSSVGLQFVKSAPSFRRAG